MSDQEKPAPQILHDPEDMWTRGEKVEPTFDQNAHTSSHQESWERDILSKLALSAINEQKKTRRWGIFFKGLFFLYLFIILAYLPTSLDGESIKRGDHSALVEIQGVIAEKANANADTIVKGLRDAFKDKNTKGIILKINSPGGSPVQAGYVNDEIVRLREKYPDIPLYAVISDTCASGGYYIAAAADKIYANKASVVGSIGVLMDGFGFVDSMKKLGVERRLLTAGENKGILDPFSPSRQEDIVHVKGLLNNIHSQFIDVVKRGRGSRLKETPEIFSGLMWTGEQSIELGLIDGLGSSSFVARELIGVEKIVDFTHKSNLFDRFADRIGVAMANVLSRGLNLSGTSLH